MNDTDPFGLIGQVLDGQFRVDKFIGEGGFSVVYRGHHVGLDEPIAIKCLKLPLSLGSALVESFVKRFRDESRLHYRLSQGNLHIARTLAHGTTMAPATGALVPYMVLEWLEGRSLAADLEVRRTYGDKGRSLTEMVELLDAAIDGLAYAHVNGVVHRDVNPGNLFLCKTQQGTKLKVLDFGVAKVFSDHALALGPRAQTIGQIRIFSPQYAAPEQFDDKVGPIGPWTDVYSLALIALEILRDAPAIEGEHIGDFAARALDPAARPTPRSLGIAVADETSAVFSSAVALSPKDRPQDAGQFWGALKHAMRTDAEKGNLPHAEAPRVSAAPGGSTASGAGKTLSVEKIPIPVRPSDPTLAVQAKPELVPDTARMAQPRSSHPFGSTVPMPQAPTLASPFVTAPMQARPMQTPQPPPPAPPARGGSFVPPPPVLSGRAPVASSLPPAASLPAPPAASLPAPAPRMSTNPPVASGFPVPPTPSRVPPPPRPRPALSILVFVVALISVCAVAYAAYYYYVARHL